MISTLKKKKKKTGILKKRLSSRGSKTFCKKIKITKVYSIAQGNGVDCTPMLINDPTKLTTEHGEDGKWEVCACEREPSHYLS